jgi:hypothetical protein
MTSNIRTGLSKRERLQSLDSGRAHGAWPPWLEWCLLIGFVVAGVGWDWYCAFEWFSRRYSLASAPVLGRMASLVLLCASIGFIAALLRGKKWQVGVVVFFLASGTLSGNLLLWWVGHR